MGRHKKALDETVILEMRQEGKTIKEISTAVGVSTPTVSRRIAVMKYEQGLLTTYRQFQGLQLTELQFKILESITPEKIEDASLLTLVKAYDVLKKIELAIQGKQSFHIDSLLHYLLKMEEKEKEGKS